MAWTALLFFACLLVCLGGGRAEAAPSGVAERQKRAADELWSELMGERGRAGDHDEWEMIVRRSADWNDPYYEDDTQHIANVQEYYRYVLEEQEWEEEEREHQQELAQLMHSIFNNRFGGQGGQATVQEGERRQEYRDIQKPIPGRYIVMLDSNANSETLDRTVAVLQRTNSESEGRIRAEHITPMRNLGGFTATMNSKAVELVSEMFTHVCDVGAVSLLCSTQYICSCVWRLERESRKHANNLLYPHTCYPPIRIVTYCNRK